MRLGPDRGGGKAGKDFSLSMPAMFVLLAEAEADAEEKLGWRVVFERFRCRFNMSL